MTDLKKRALEITLELATHRTLYRTHGIKSPISVRAALEAEAADIALQMYTVRAQYLADKNEACKIKANAYLKALIQKVKNVGLDHLVQEAHLESLAEVESAGLTSVYLARR